MLIYISWDVEGICKRKLLSIHIVELYGWKIQLRLHYRKQLNENGTRPERIVQGMNTCALHLTDTSWSAVSLHITCSTYHFGIKYNVNKSSARLRLRFVSAGKVSHSYLKVLLNMVSCVVCAPATCQAMQTISLFNCNFLRYVNNIRKSFQEIFLTVVQL